jgi:hypothetical protein
MNSDDCLRSNSSRLRTEIERKGSVRVSDAGPAQAVDLGKGRGPAAETLTDSGPRRPQTRPTAVDPKRDRQTGRINSKLW